MQQTRTIVGLITALLVLSISACDFGPEPDTTTLAAFGGIHAPIGSASLQTEGESLVVDLSGPAAAGGVAVEMGHRDRLNVYFEPIEMPVGSVFETAVVGVVDGHETVLGRIMHRQTGTHTTAIGLDFNELKRFTASRRVAVSTFVDGVETYKTTLPVDSTATVGFVQSGDSDWATSYHWVYINGAWSLMIDPAPSETFTFADSPDVRIPFNYLVFTIEDVEGVSRPAAMEFVGEGLRDFKIVGEDDRKLVF